MARLHPGCLGLMRHMTPGLVAAYPSHRLRPHASRHPVGPGQHPLMVLGDGGLVEHPGVSSAPFINGLVWIAYRGPPAALAHFLTRAISKASMSCASSTKRMSGVLGASVTLSRESSIRSVKSSRSLDSFHWFH